jgi:hypothetical protein
MQSASAKRSRPQDLQQMESADRSLRAHSRQSAPGRPSRGSGASGTANGKAPGTAAARPARAYLVPPKRNRRRAGDERRRSAVRLLRAAAWASRRSCGVRARVMARPESALHAPRWLRRTNRRPRRSPSFAGGSHVGDLFNARVFRTNRPRMSPWLSMSCGCRPRRVAIPGRPPRRPATNRRTPRSPGRRNGPPRRDRRNSPPVSGADRRNSAG